MLRVSLFLCRIKGNMTGGGLVVGVEATPAPAGEFLSPLQLRLRTRGSMDRPDTVTILFTYL